MGDANAETAYRAALGRLIARLREARGLTQGVVARRVGLSQPTFSRLELGGSGLTPWTLRQLAQIFAVAPGRLVHLVELALERAAAVEAPRRTWEQMAETDRGLATLLSLLDFGVLKAIESTTEAPQSA